MGSISRVEIHYIDLIPFLENLDRAFFIADLEGTSLNEQSFDPNPVIVFGNEANGISDRLKKLNAHKVTIPKKGGAESLNLSSSVAIVLSRL